MNLKRLSRQPVIQPVPEHTWEKSAVFNAAMVYFEDKFHCIYRATDIGGHERYGRYINSFGYATSTDLLHWERRAEPILANDVPQELRGPEDPRIVQIGDLFYMTYTGFGDRFLDDYRICLATSKDLIHWERQGMTLNEPNKDASLFPEKINGRFCMFHRRYPDIWLCYSEDLKTWTDHQKIMSPIPHTWESERIGIAGPPVKLNGNWFLIYHGVDNQGFYRLGACLLDEKDPARVLKRYPEPIIGPELNWELEGFVPNVIFSCGTVLKDDTIYCLYGGADTVLGIASMDVSEINF